eukprot:COSAG01_NODE_60_length_29981_cov_23.262533_8_plen_107_part_00
MSPRAVTVLLFRACDNTMIYNNNRILYILYTWLHHIATADTSSSASCMLASVLHCSNTLISNGNNTVVPTPLMSTLHGPSGATLSLVLFVHILRVSSATLMLIPKI